MVILGIVILLYADRFVDDLRVAMLQDFDVAFEWTWDLLTILLWILVAWLFVDAALTVALSFSENKYTLVDVMNRLERMEKKMGARAGKEGSWAEETEEEEVAKIEEAQEEEVPPPPPAEH